MLGVRRDDRHAAWRVLDWLIDAQVDARRAPLADRQRLVAARRAEVPLRPAADRGDGPAARRRGGLRRDRATHRYRAAMERAYGWFLGENDLGLRGRGSRPRRLPRRPDAATASTRNQGAESTLMWLIAARAHARALRARRSPHDRRRPVATPAARRRDRMTRPARAVHALRGQPDPDRRRTCRIPANSVFNPGCGAGRRRDGAARPRRGPARHLAAPRRPQRGRRVRLALRPGAAPAIRRGRASRRRSGAARTRA